MAKRQLYYQVDIREVERLLGTLKARNAEPHLDFLLEVFTWLGVTPDPDKVNEHAHVRQLPSWADVRLVGLRPNAEGRLIWEEI